jgi:ADP-heptose:LPS heptosyltransferase
MHLCEIYALTCGLKINKPFIKLSEIDLPKDPYITFHPDFSKGVSRRYSYWSSVIDRIKDLGYKIYRVGTDDKSFDHADVDDTYFKKCSISETAYLIKNASLHLGYDSSLVHVASVVGQKIVSIYQCYSSHSYPYWSEDEDIRLIEPDWTIQLPPMIYQEEQKYPVINTISPIEIASAVKELLS